MKVREIILERKKNWPKTVRHAAVHAKHYDNMDSYYEYYRFGIAMAAHANSSTPHAGPQASNPSLWMYTDGDEEIVKAAEKNQGKKGKTVVTKPSSELGTTNTKSPVAKKKKNKYGV